MNDTDTARNSLAQAIAGFRVAETQANRSLMVLSSNLHNVAAQHGLYRLADEVAGHRSPRVMDAIARVNAGFAAGTAQMGD